MVQMNSLLELPAAKLRHSISIERRTSSNDSFGQPVTSWNSVLVTRAAIEMLSQREMYQSGQLTGQVTHIVTIRWPGILVLLVPGMRVRFSSHLYQIQAVDNVEQRCRVVRLMVLELNGSDA